MPPPFWPTWPAVSRGLPWLEEGLSLPISVSCLVDSKIGIDREGLAAAAKPERESCIMETSKLRCMRGHKKGNDREGEKEADSGTEATDVACKPDDTGQCTILIRPAIALLVQGLFEDCRG